MSAPAEKPTTELATRRAGPTQRFTRKQQQRLDEIQRDGTTATVQWGGGDIYHVTPHAIRINDWRTPCPQ